MEKNNLLEAYKFYEILYDQYAPKAYGFLLGQLQKKQDAENVLMEIFEKIWEDLDTFKTDTEKRIKKIIVSTYYQSSIYQKGLIKHNQLI